MRRGGAFAAVLQRIWFVDSMQESGCTGIPSPRARILRNSECEMGETVSSERETYDHAGWLMLAGLTASAAMRFYRLDLVPAGLHFDEAFNGLDSLALLHLPLNEWPIFFEGNSGRESLFVWLSGVAHALLGPSIWTARCVAALSGTLLTPALAWLGWQTAPMLGVRRRQQFSLWCATVILALLWSQIFSRFRGPRHSVCGRPDSAVGGSVAGLATSSSGSRRVADCWVLGGTKPLYILARTPTSISPSAPAGLCRLCTHSAPETASSRNCLRPVGGAIGHCAVGRLFPAKSVCILQSYRTGGRSRKQGRSFQSVSRAVCSSRPGILVSHNNLSARPALDPLLALPFLIGVGLTLFRFWKLGRIFLIAGMSTQLLPTVLSTNAPNFLRSIGVLPFIALFTALGAEFTVRFLERLRSGASRPAQAMVWAVFAASVVLTNWIYFGVWASTPELFYDFDEGFTKLVRQIVDERDAAIYVNTHGGVRHPAVFYLLTQYDASARFYDGEECLPVALTGAVRHFYLANEKFRSRLQASSYYPRASPQSTVIFDRSGKPWLAETRNAAGGPVVFPKMSQHEVKMADGINLAGYSLSQDWIQAGHPLRLRLFWQASERPSADYTTFIHLVQMKEDGSTTRVAGFDRRPGDGNCQTIHWLPGEIIIDDAVLHLPADLPKSELFLAMGFYSVSDGRRLPVDGRLTHSSFWGRLLLPHEGSRIDAATTLAPARTVLNTCSHALTSPRPSPARPGRERLCWLAAHPG